MTDAFLSLGSNLGERDNNLKAALSEIGGEGILGPISSFYETSPVGRLMQPPFVNCAARISTEEGPATLLERIQAIEKKLGRWRSARWGPRIIDIDIILYGGAVIETSRLRIPHPEMARRKFVLVPLAEISPGTRHPVLGKTFSEMLGSLADETQRVEKIQSFQAKY